MQDNWVREIFDYRDGALWWRKPGGKRRMDRPAGCLFTQNKKPYWIINYNYYTYRRARLVWYWHKGRWPDCLIHRDKDSLDDHIENLREVDRSILMLRRGKFRTSTGKKYIYFKKNPHCKRGFYYIFLLRTPGNRRFRVFKSSTDLEYLVKYRNDWIMKNDIVRYMYLLRDGEI